MVIYKTEWQQTLQDAETQAPWLSAWLGFCCIFGKRRNEICKLLRQNIWVKDGYLNAKFFVGKKKQRTSSIDLAPFTKKITVKHYAVPYITRYLDSLDFREGYIFPWKRPHKPELIVHSKFKNKDGKDEIREYHYIVQQGYRSPQNVCHHIKKVNPNIWPHLGRHTVATRAAEEGATEYDIQNILDITARTASSYVHHGTKLTERWSEKTE
jgi:integrase